MLSLIVCSRHHDISLTLKDNINQTIGVDYELVVIDNSGKQYSIFSAYNEGVRRSKGEILCFMHEDILYQENNWGQNVINHFSHDGIGMIGVIGGHYWPNTACYGTDSEMISSNYIQHIAEGQDEQRNTVEHFSSNGDVESVALDGVWLAIPRLLFDAVSFDEGYKGFHFYDMDISMQIWASGYKCCVVNDVLLTHYNNSAINTDFMNNAYRFFKKWKAYFPMEKGWSYSQDEYRVAGLLCQYKMYSRELKLENDRLNVLANSRLGSLAIKIGKYKEKIVKKWKRITLK